MPPVSLASVVAANVRAQRARQRMTQQELADELGWSRPSLALLENESRRVTLEDAAEVCKALKIDLVELLSGAPKDVLQTLGLGS